MSGVRHSYNKQQLMQFTEKVAKPPCTLGIHRGLQIREGYRAYWLVDNLPAATKIGLETDSPDGASENVRSSHGKSRGVETGSAGELLV